MTAKIKLNAASGGGSVSLKAPSTTTGNAAIELQLPVADGSANQVLKTDGSGSLSFAADSGGLNASYAKLTDTKGTTTQGGTFTSGDWRTRDINTEDNDDDGIVSISSNQFTLQAGTYHIHAQCCAVGVDNHSARIYNITDGSTTLTGLANKTNEENVSSFAQVIGQFTISGAKVFELQHRCHATVSTHGMGAYSNWNSNIYSIIEIYKRN